nr:mannonate dehydratase [Salinicoccus albus]
MKNFRSFHHRSPTVFLLFISLPGYQLNYSNLHKLLDTFDSPNHGLTFCSGSLGANPDNDLIDIINTFSSRIHFAHVRNLKLYDNGSFMETSHLMSDGSLDIPGIVRALYESEFSGYLRPDHGRDIWDENSRPGYGLYDRALGAMYLRGLWDSSVNLK